MLETLMAAKPISICRCHHRLTVIFITVLNILKKELKKRYFCGYNAFWFMMCSSFPLEYTRPRLHLSLQYNIYDSSFTRIRTDISPKECKSILNIHFNCVFLLLRCCLFYMCWATRFIVWFVWLYFTLRFHAFFCYILVELHNLNYKSFHRFNNLREDPENPVNVKFDFHNLLTLYNCQYCIMYLVTPWNDVIIVLFKTNLYQKLNQKLNWTGKL